MRTNSAYRKRRFMAAVALAGTTVKAWAEGQGVSKVHLFEVLRGRRVPGAELNASIDAFIEKHLHGVAAA